MRQMVAVLVALAAGATWLATGSIASAPAPRTAAPAGILVYVNQSRCYPPGATVPVQVENLTPGSLVQAISSEGVIEEVLGSAKAAPAGVTKLPVKAPDLPSGKRIEAHLLKIEGTDATGRLTSSVTAFVLATRSLCKTLNERHSGGARL
jgi:hypothetical protein